MAPPVTPQPEPVPAIADPVVSAAPSRPVLVPVLLWGGAAAALASGIVLGAMSSGSYAQVNNASKDGSLQRSTEVTHLCS